MEVLGLNMFNTTPIQIKVQKNLVQKNWVQKNLGSRKVLGPKYVSSQKEFGSKNILGPKYF